MAERWRVGVVEAPITTFLSSDFRPVVHWLSRAGCARPYGMVNEFGLQVFCEVQDRRQGRSHLAWLRAGEPVPLLGFPAEADLGHPYMVEEDGELYCLPHELPPAELQLYQRSTSGQWAYAATPLPGFAASDAALFRIEERWWLACSRPATGDGLWLWHAPTLRGPWQPHAANPVRAGAGAACAAGTPFLHQGVLYRPAREGTGMVIQRVLKLTPASYAEEPAVHLRSHWPAPWGGGWQTLAAVGAITLVDGCGGPRLPRWRSRA
ncbi:MAG: glucosamine inositolphosphorylceramide transferase family protein [Terriglobales bacterium]